MRVAGAAEEPSGRLAQVVEVSRLEPDRGEYLLRHVDGLAEFAHRLLEVAELAPPRSRLLRAAEKVDEQRLARVCERNRADKPAGAEESDGDRSMGLVAMGEA